jgi:hypothetical protein
MNAAAMNGRSHYDASATRPAENSRYAFLLRAVAINDTEPLPPMWRGPVNITPDMPTKTKAYWARWNPTLVAFDGSLRKRAIETLRLAGVPEINLDAPLSAGVEAAIIEITNGRRRELEDLNGRSVIDGLRRGTPFSGELFSRELCARVIVAAGRALGSPGHKATAKYLNDGARGYLTRDHVGRADARWNKMLERLLRATRHLHVYVGAPESVVVELLAADAVHIRALDIVYRDARAHPELRKHRGEDLAVVIHDKFDINEIIYRAAKIVQPNW